MTYDILYMYLISLNKPFTNYQIFEGKKLIKSIFDLFFYYFSLNFLDQSHIISHSQKNWKWLNQLNTVHVHVTHKVHSISLHTQLITHTNNNNKNSVFFLKMMIHVTNTYPSIITLPPTSLNSVHHTQQSFPFLDLLSLSRTQNIFPLFMKWIIAISNIKLSLFIIRNRVLPTEWKTKQDTIDWYPQAMILTH